MGQALYRKYRPKKLGDVVGQEHITTTLQHTLEKGSPCHAYLFTGPRGTGKTTIARILAHEINQLPYTDDSTHLDIIEIDAASNRRIDEIRDLRDKVHIAPSSAKYKVYIIDEVHMLTREAFNALLKTLEEPPAHVIFILATTELHKLPETIISRTQRYTFKSVDLLKVSAHLRAIAEQEGITIDDEALNIIAEHGEGSFRDSISLLDQSGRQNGEVTVDDVRAILGIPPENAVSTILTALERHNSSTIVTTLRQLETQGFTATQIAKQLATRIRMQLIEGTSKLGKSDGLPLLKQLVETPVSANPAQYLELALLDITLADSKPYVTNNFPAGNQQSTINDKQPATDILPIRSEATDTKPERIVAPPEEKVERTTPATTKPPAAENKPQAVDDEPKPRSTGNAPVDDNLWPNILGALKQQYNTLYGIARMAEPEFGDSSLTLYMRFGFHQKRLSEVKNKQIIATIVENLTGQTVSIECILHEASNPPAVEPVSIEPAAQPTESPAPVIPLPEPAPAQPKPPAASIETISNIFGGAELLES